MNYELNEEGSNVRVLPVALKFDKGQIQLGFRQTEFLWISENCLPCPGVGLDPCPCLPELGTEVLGDHTRDGAHKKMGGWLVGRLELEAVVEKVMVAKSHWT